MNTNTINSYEELLLQISTKKQIKLEEEAELKCLIKDFVHSFSPSSIIKNSLHELNHDKEVGFDLAKLGMNIGANLLIDKTLGRNKSIKGFLSSLLIEKISSVLISRNGSKIVTSIKNFISPNNL